MLILSSVSSSLVDVVAPDPASGARATVSVTEEAVPRFATWSQGEAWRVEQPPRQQPEQWWPLGEQHRVAGVMRDVAGPSIDGGPRTIRGR